MSQATQHMLSNTWADRGTRDVYADYNELTLSITTNALFGVDMSSSQSAGISSKHPGATPLHAQQQVTSTMSDLHCVNTLASTLSASQPYLTLHLYPCFPRLQTLPA